MVIEYRWSHGIRQCVASEGPHTRSNYRPEQLPAGGRPAQGRQGLSADPSLVLIDVWRSSEAEGRLKGGGNMGGRRGCVAGWEQIGRGREARGRRGIGIAAREEVKSKREGVGTEGARGRGDGGPWDGCAGRWGGIIGRGGGEARGRMSRLVHEGGGAGEKEEGGGGDSGSWTWGTGRADKGEGRR